MVNKENLVSDLSLYCDVIFCDVHNDNFVLVLNCWNTTLDVYMSIYDIQLKVAYPGLVSFSYNNGVIKGEYSK